MAVTVQGSGFNGSGVRAEKRMSKYGIDSLSFSYKIDRIHSYEIRYSTFCSSLFNLEPRTLNPEPTSR